VMVFLPFRYTDSTKCERLEASFMLVEAV
jgi:hypothetical protein